jgi:hypothetical protein
VPKEDSSGQASGGERQCDNGTKMCTRDGQSRDLNIKPRVGAAPGSAHHMTRGPTARMRPFVPLRFHFHISVLFPSSILSFSLPSYPSFLSSILSLFPSFPSFPYIFCHDQPPFLLPPISVISSLSLITPSFRYHSLPFLTHFTIFSLVFFILMSLFLPSCLPFCLSSPHSSYIPVYFIFLLALFIYRSLLFSSSIYHFMLYRPVFLHILCKLQFIQFNRFYDTNVIYHTNIPATFSRFRHCLGDKTSLHSTIFF